MIHDDSVRQQVYQELLSGVHARLVSVLHTPETEALPLGYAINLIFLLRGNWGDIGDYSSTIQAVGELVGKDLLWLSPPKAGIVVQVPIVQ